METEERNSSNTEETIPLKDLAQNADHQIWLNKDVKLLLVTNNRMPIISNAAISNNHDDAATTSQCIPPKTRLCLLVGIGILSLVSAIGFLLGVRFAYPNPREHIPKNVSLSPRFTQYLWCNISEPNPLDNFFGYPVSLLIWCNESLGICLAVVTAILLGTTIYLRHPVCDKTKDSSGIQRNSVLKTNLVLLIVGWFACINLILLAWYDITVHPWHNYFALGCFGSFIIYELAHNCCLVNDILRNRILTWKNESKDNFRQLYVIFTSLALLLGVTSNILTISGFVLKGMYGARFQWMTILSILGYFLPVYLIIVIRDYSIYRQK